MCSIICTIPQGLLRAAGCTKWSIRAKLAAEAHKPGAQRKVPAFMVTATPKRNVPFDSGQSTSCATKIKTQRPKSHPRVWSPDVWPGDALALTTWSWELQEVSNYTSQNALLHICLVEASSSFPHPTWCLSIYHSTEMKNWNRSLKVLTQI